MKALIKSSFLLLLLVTVNIGMSNAYAANTKSGEKFINTSKVENINAIPLRCHVKSTLSLTKMFISNSNASYDLLSKSAYFSCDASATTLGNGDTYVVTADCRLYVITAGGKVFRLV